MSRRARVAAVAVALLLGLGVLAACSGSDDPPPSSADTDPGRALQTMNADGLPADYPRDEAPLIAGEVTSVNEGGKKDPGYAVSILTDQSPSEAVAQAVSLLEDAGWQAQTDPSGDPPAVQVLTKGSDQVIIDNNLASDLTVITYAVNIS